MPTSGPEATFREVLALDSQWRRRHLPEPIRRLYSRINDKAVSKALVSALGLPQAEIHSVGLPLADAIEYAEQRRLDRFVVKPREAKDSIGVRGLVREGSDFRCILTGRRRSRAGLEEELRAVMNRHGRTDAWIIEELLLPPEGKLAPVDDFKFYAFYGEIVCILHKRRSFGWKRMTQWHQWYGPHWNVIDSGKHPHKVNPDMRPPPGADLLLQTAQNWSLRLLIPFARLDLYDTTRGAVLGEITPRPGNQDGFSAEWQSRLNKAWQDAAKRLAGSDKATAIHQHMQAWAAIR